MKLFSCSSVAQPAMSVTSGSHRSSRLRMTPLRLQGLFPSDFTTINAENAELAEALRVSLANASRLAEIAALSVASAISHECRDGTPRARGGCRVDDPNGRGG